MRTVRWLAPGMDCSRLKSWSVHLSSALVAEPRPSVSESPTTSMAAVLPGSSASRPLRKYQCATDAAPGRSASSRWLPATMYVVVREPGWEVMELEACPADR